LRNIQTILTTTWTQDIKPQQQSFGFYHYNRNNESSMNMAFFSVLKSEIGTFLSLSKIG